MRIGFLPRFTGSNFTQVVYRAIIRAPNNERGVYFVRSDADSIWMSITGNIFSNFNFNLADIKWSGKEQLPWIGPGSLDEENLHHFHQPTGVEWLPAPEPKMNSRHEEGKGQQQQQPIISFSLTPWSQQQQNGTEPARIVASYDFSTTSLTMPSTSLFAGQHVREAQKYFVELYAAFQSWPTGDEDDLSRCRWSSVHIDRTRWNVTAVDHQEHSPMIYEFMQNSSFFPKDSCRLDSIFYVSDLDYHWHVGQYHSTPSIHSR